MPWAEANGAPAVKAKTATKIAKSRTGWQAVRNGFSSQEFEKIPVVFQKW
jgi:hypothetical protein